MNDARPDPDALLSRVQREEARARRGQLKIFFGGSAGVGKTYAMLEAAQKARREGIDVVAGYVELHGRADTEALLAGLEILPRRTVEHRGVALSEFDLDAALARAPALLLVDELAHTNPPALRHPKRWQDIEELRDAGIDVYTSLNVQHLESLNDVVAQITGVRVQETLPDHVFDDADEVELVDLPADDLLERLEAGKIYVPAQVRHALEGFFRKGNLIALRELALRATAERVDAQMRDYREDHAIDETWAAGERVLVCIGPGPLAETVVRTGKRIAATLHADWTVLFVETPALVRMSDAERNERVRLLRLAESLGAETVTLAGHAIAAEVLAYARTRNVTRIVVGRSLRPRWKRWLWPSPATRLVEEAAGLNVTVVGGDAELAGDATVPQQRLLSRSRDFLGLGERERAPKDRRPGYAAAVAVSALATAIAALMSPYLQPVNLVMVYLLGVVAVATRFGRGPSVLTAFLSVFAFDFFFVSPQFSVAVSDTEYLLTFGVMLAVGLVIGNLAASVRLQARVAGHRERRTAALYAMSRELAASREPGELMAVALRHVADTFESQVTILLPDTGGRIRHPRGEASATSFRGADLGVAQWVFDHWNRAGLGSDTLPGQDALYLPLSAATGTLGVLAVLPANPRRVLLPEQMHLLETFASQIALALERTKLAEAAQGTQLKIEGERLRNALLAGVSHDLRTPLSVIAGAASTLALSGERLTPEQRAELTRAIYEEAEQMNALVGNMLEMTRLESGTPQLRRDWHSIEEITGVVLARFRRKLEGRPVETEIPADLPLVRIDGVLIEQVMANLLQNALKYTPAGTPVEIGAAADADAVTVSVADRGPGLSTAALGRVFDKFYRENPESAVTGAGLGLSICRAIVEAHGGRIEAANRAGGGAVFRFTLPREASEPTVEAEPGTSSVVHPAGVA
jgi:two-component system sensor histidine kinase KdpD